ncbi:MAG: translocation/assembly module TamB domain-containing protein [Myxococcales bacterium]|nr:translocation/assembly module TamB domain-containing protein [Myxococcales bacterium]
MRLAAALLAAIGVLLAAAGVAYLYLTSEAGEERVRRALQVSARDAFRGELSFGELDLHGSLVTARDVELRDPDGELVAQVERVSARVSLGGLYRRTLRLSPVRIVRPRLQLRWKGDQLNLVTALEPRREPKGPRGKGPIASFLVEFRVEDAEASLLLPEGLPFTQRHRVIASGRGTVRQRGVGHLFARVALEGRTYEPLEGPAAVALSIEAAPDRSTAAIDLRGKGLHLEAQAFHEGGTTRIQLGRLQLEPAAGRAALDGYPLAAPLEVKGKLAHRGGRIQLELSASAAGAKATLRGAVDLDSRSARPLELRAEGVDLRRLLGSGPTTRLSLSAVARGGGGSLGAARGTLEIRLDPSRLAGRPVGPGRATITAGSGAFSGTFDTKLEGGRLWGDARWSAREIWAELSLSAEDLAPISKLASELAGRRALALSGPGWIQATVEGPSARPQARLLARAYSLRRGAVEVDGLSLVGRVPDISSPLSSLFAVARADRLRLSGRAIAGPELRVGAANGGMFLAQARAGELSLAVAARLLEESRVEIGELALRYPGAQWELRQAALIELGEEGVAVRGLTLASGPQSAALEGELREGKLDARLTLRRLDLARLPAELRSRLPEISGELTATVRARGPLGRPVAEVEARLVRGAVAHLRGISLEASASSDGERLLGDASARSADGRAAVQFDVPFDPRKRPLRIKGTARNLRLSRVLGPAVSELSRLPSADASVSIESDPANGTRARADIATSEGTIHLDARSPVGLAELADLRAIDQLARIPLEATVAAKELRLGSSAGAKGLLEGRARVQGTLDRPTLKAEAAISELAFNGAPVGSATVELRYASGVLTARASLDARGKGRVDLGGRASVDLSPGSLRRGFALSTLPLEASLKTSGLELDALGLLLPGADLGGRLLAEATVSGTLQSPDFRGRLELSDGSLAVEGYGSYRGIHLVATGDASGLEITALEARAGDGLLRLRARGRRDGERLAFAGSGSIRSFPIVTGFRRRAEVSTRLQFSGELRAALFHLRDLRLEKTRIEIPEERRNHLQPIERPKGLVLVERQDELQEPRAKKLPSPSAPKPGAFQVLVEARAPDGVTLVGPDLRADLEIPERLRLEHQGKPQLFGEVRVLRGFVEVLGRRFELIEDSRLEFRGPPIAPYLFLTAQHVERDQVALFIEIRGSGKDMTIASYSDPPVSELGLYSQLASGRPPPPGAATGQAASFVGSFAGSFLLRLLGTKVPLDVVSVEAGQGGLAQATVQVGTYLGDRLFLGYASQPGADPRRGENESAIRVEYRLGRRWSFQAEYGDANAGGADIVWSRRF